MLAARRSEVALRAAMFVLAGGAVFGWLGPQFQHEVGLPPIDLDAAAGSPARTLDLMQHYGPLGRRDYLVFLSLDCLLPVTFSLLLLALFEAATRALALGPSARRTLVIAGALPALCDLAENTLYALMAILYPRHALSLAQLAYAATTLKIASALCATALLGLVGTRWLRTRRSLPARSSQRF